MPGAFPKLLLILRLFNTFPSLSTFLLAKLASKATDLPPVNTPIVHFSKLKGKGARLPSAIIVATYAKPSNSMSNVYVKEKKIAPI